MTAHEVVVLGAGPAGCAAATLLARRAHDVALVRPRHTPAGTLAESIPPSARKLLNELGLLEAVDAAGLHRNEGNAVWWAAQPRRTERFSDGHGVNVLREELEGVLVAAAESVGVRVYEATTAREAAESNGWIVRCETGESTPLGIRADWLIDGTGRHGLVARREGRVADRDTTTLALVQRWTRADDRVGDPAEDAVADTMTLIESHAAGWLWSIPVDGRTRVVTAMIDQRRTPVEGSDLGVTLGAELAHTPHLRTSLDAWTPAGTTWACPASLYHARRFAREGLLLVGDAASAIDPLSSYGVKKALASGWLAGVVVHTALVDPAMIAPALDFFDAQERALYRESRRASATFFEEAAQAYGHPFWTDRARAAVSAADEIGEGESLTVRDVPEEDVRAAFEVIRARPRLDAVVGPTLRRVTRPTVRGHRVVMVEHLASASRPEGLRWVRDVDLAHLLEVAPRHVDVAEGWGAYNASAAPVSLPDYLTALSTAFAAGFLVHRDS